MKVTGKYIVFTDLDGTLLNHDDYAYKTVITTIKQLKDQGIPVILNSSKTLSELVAWRGKLNLSTPLIAENGGVVLMTTPQGEVKHLIGKHYQIICNTLQLMRQQYGWKFIGFNDWSAQEVKTNTGLSFQESIMAKERSVTEPILWQDSEENLTRFKKKLAEFDLILKKGGRFYHVMAKHDKADAMNFILSTLEHPKQKSIQTIVLGDGENDLSMLNAADMAAVLPAASGQSLQVANAYYSKQNAPHGWVEAIESILANPSDYQKSLIQKTAS